MFVPNGIKQTDNILDIYILEKKSEGWYVSRRKPPPNGGGLWSAWAEGIAGEMVLTPGIPQTPQPPYPQAPVLFTPPSFTDGAHRRGATHSQLLYPPER